MCTYYKLLLIFTDTIQDLDASIRDLATQFVKTDIKSLEDELAHRNLQSRFDTRATSQLRIWKKLVRSLQQNALFANKL